MLFRSGRVVEELAAAASSTAAVGEEVVQPVDEAEEPEDAAEGVGELCELVDNAGDVNSSICARSTKLTLKRTFLTFFYFFLLLLLFFSFFFTC